MSLIRGIEKIVKSHGAELYSTETVNESGNTIFRVYVTKMINSKDLLDIDLCADISRDLSPFLDVNPPVDGAYYLEVSSPGIERRLEKPAHFISYIGGLIKFKLKGGKRFKGVLIGADEDGFILEVKGEKYPFKYSDISGARTYYEWGDIY